MLGFQTSAIVFSKNVVNSIIYSANYGRKTEYYLNGTQENPDWYTNVKGKDWITNIFNLKKGKMYLRNH